MNDAILKLTKQLMKISSTKDDAEALSAALDIVKKELQGYYPIEEYESQGIKSLLIHNTTHRTKHFKIILNAHVDVVTGTKKQFSPLEKDGKLYGRGSYDMKAATAVMVILFKQLAKKISYPLALQVVTDEETGGLNGTHYQVKEGLRGDFVITGDCGSNLNIVNQAKGIMWLKLHSSGRKAHGAYLWRGDNALWKLHHALAALHKIFPVPSEEKWVTTMNLAKIETDNNAFNHVPEGATAYLDFRFIAKDEKNIMAKIIKAISPDIEIEIMFCNPPEYVAPDNDYLKRLGEMGKKVIGEEPQLIAAHAPSDIRHYNEVGCVGVGFGPKGAYQHADDEWVDIKSLEEYYYILERFLLSLEK
ncbi:MAG TPA: M20/M25/M40 family metallo-hydrolase [Methylomirabilota bacterium]|nr:M20/M25/M40 family metallo-hydrolase [Methylomirabilota bacterium]